MNAKRLIPICTAALLPFTGLEAQTTASTPGGVVSATQANIPDGVAKLGGDVYLLRNNNRARITDEYKLPNGTRVRPDGTMIMADGSQAPLREGQMITMDGKIQIVPMEGSLGTTERPNAGGTTTRGAVTNSGGGSVTGASAESTLPAPTASPATSP